MKRVKLIPPSARVICYHCWEYNRFTFTIYHDTNRDPDEWTLETTGQFDFNFRNWRGTLAEIEEYLDGIAPDWRDLEFWDKNQLCNRTCGDALREEATAA